MTLYEKNRRRTARFLSYLKKTYRFYIIPYRFP
jgi:hypothetical protein